MKIRLVLAVLSASIHLSTAEPVVCKSIDEAIARGNLEAVQSFLATDLALAKAGASPRMSPLHEAAASGGVEIIALLLNHGVDPTTVSQTGDTALAIAGQRGDAAIIAALDSAVAQNP